ncbi:amidase domain-containing protein [Cohnella caldifontis]|uniref:amidase domain-containing protein n=1 Tax=Cohnella caldifontis TaxID=3027471 RepID=UPI0023EDF60D|nr:amidase domain-containing protein [Cohnella sp. YIM B05605]
MPESIIREADWKNALFAYVSSVNEAGLRGDDDFLSKVKDPAHRRRLSARLSESLRREAERGIRVSRSEVRTRIERRFGGGKDVAVDVSMHVVRTCEQRGISWQEERVERERIRFVFAAGRWEIDTAEPLAGEGMRRVHAPVPEDDPEELFERRDAMPSVPLIHVGPQRGNRSKVYAGGGPDGAYGYDPYRRGIPYRRAEAVAYAERWWNEMNPAYEGFEVNCTNYVSQCLFAGQAPMNYTGKRESGWWYKGRLNGREWWSFSWAVADGLQRFLSLPRGYGLRAEAVDSPDWLQLGDVICYDWDGYGRFGHNTIVTAFAPDGTPLVNANTVSSRHRYWDYRDSYAWTGKTRYRFFHIADEF